ncbi:MAG: hypothetical protein ABH828_00105 [archaeon]
MMTFARRKDGSLNLSIQAIVVLVMAMAILGLGLGFIRGLIGKGEVNLGKAIDNAALENPADSNSPVTIDRTVEIKAGKTAKMKIGFYNAGSTNTAGFVPALDANCKVDDDEVKETNENFLLASGAQTVPIGEARGYEAVLTAPINAPAGSTKVCTVEFWSGDTTPVVVASKQFYIDIIS